MVEPRASTEGDKRADDPIVIAADNWARSGWPVGDHFRASVSVLRVAELIRLSDALALAPFKLTPARHEALAVLYFSRSGQLPMGKLSKRLMVHPTSVTSTIDALERRGYVERIAHPTDRRATLARVTSAGREAMETTCAEMAAAGAGLAVLSEQQARAVFTTLRHVRRAAGDLATDTEPSVDPIEGAANNWHERGWPAGDRFRASLSILRAAELIQKADATVLTPFKLTVARHEALAVIYFSRSGQLPMGKLSKRLMVHPTSVTSTVDALERLGYVERTAHPNDRRATLARITGAGRRAIETTCAEMAATGTALAVLSDQQAHTIFTTLRRVRQAAGDLTPAR